MTGPAIYRKRPVEVAAIRWSDGTPMAEIHEFLCGPSVGERYERHTVTSSCWLHLEAQPDRLRIFNRSHGDWNAVNYGDWIVLGPAGEFYPVEHEIFLATFDPVGPASEQVSIGDQNRQEVNPMETRPDETQSDQQSGDQGTQTETTTRETTEREETKTEQPAENTGADE